jgi:hypothetical protein
MDLYSTADMLDVLRYTRQPTRWFLDRFFPRAINFTTEQIFFDRVFDDNRLMAPFVVPNVQGRVLGMTGYDSVSFKPAYVKPKYVVDPNMVLPRRAGETPFTGTLSPQQRKDAVMAELTQKGRDAIANRNEWLGAQALQYGQVTIVGEDYPSTLVDFRRDASLTSVLTGAARWSQATSDPDANLRFMRNRSNILSGSRITDYVFGQDAWEKYTSRVNVRDQMDKRYDGYDSRVSMVLDGYEGVEYVGRLGGLDGKGKMDIWIHTGKLIDPVDNTEKFIFDQNSVMGVSAQTVQGVRCFGAIKDFDANLQALEIFAKNWRNEDPSVEYILMQSAPLMIPKQPNGTFLIDTGT